AHWCGSRGSRGARTVRRSGLRRAIGRWGRSARGRSRGSSIGPARTRARAAAQASPPRRRARAPRSRGLSGATRDGRASPARLSHGVEFRRMLMMKTTRLEAFSDGVIAILITIMVLELKTPPGRDWAALTALAPHFCPYVLSFIMLVIYWNNHHHLIHMTDRVTVSMLWANLHLLFWLSLLPVGTAWVGETELAPVPTAVYGAIFMLAGTAYFILKTAIIRSQGPHSKLQAALGSDTKGIVSVLMYAAAIPPAFVHPLISAAIYVAVAGVWLVPDRRIERRLHDHEGVSR